MKPFLLSTLIKQCFSKNQKKFIHSFFPYTCIFCNARTKQEIDLCDECENDLPKILHTCFTCGMPITQNQEEKLICGDCQKNPPYYQRTYTAFHYEKPISILITHLKFHHKLLYAKILGKLFIKKFSEDIEKDPPEIIIPLPLHYKRLKERGFNQSLEIAREISKSLKIPFDIKHCYRIKATVPQSEISAKLREDNIKNAFTVSEKFHAKHVAIFDDVVTTGNTVREFAKVLRKNGVEKIDVWCCARTGFEN